MPARLSAFVIWALVAAGLVFWGYRLYARPIALPANVQTVAEGPGAAGDLSRMFGAAPAPQSVEAEPAVQSSRFRLLGVLAPVSANGVAGRSKAGIALIAMDGKPARAYAVGSRLDGSTVLQSISRRSASLGPEQGATSVVLQLPAPPPPATGNLPRAGADGEPTLATAPTPMPLPPQAPPGAPTPLPPQAVPQALPADEPPQADEAPAPRRRRGSQSPASL